MLAGPVYDGRAGLFQRLRCGDEIFHDGTCVSEWLCPPSATEWFQAMESEACYVEPGLKAFRFVAGCVVAAFCMRVSHESEASGRFLGPGLATGLLFGGHAMAHNSRAWPLIWPTLGGVLAYAYR